MSCTIMSTPHTICYVPYLAGHTTGDTKVLAHCVGTVLSSHDSDCQWCQPLHCCLTRHGHTCSEALTKKYCCFRRSSLPSGVESLGYRTALMAEAESFSATACRQHKYQQLHHCNACMSNR